jgi:hypothetical protein
METITQTMINKAKFYLVTENEEQIISHLESIYNTFTINQNELIDNVNGIKVWEKIQNQVTCKDFVKLVGL